MTEVHGEGGWHLILRCDGCSAEATFKGVVPDLATERAAAAGWQFAVEPLALSRGDTVPGLCPKECTCPT